jgi:hypothetical protein
MTKKNAHACTDWIAFTPKPPRRRLTEAEIDAEILADPELSYWVTTAELCAALTAQDTVRETWPDLVPPPEDPPPRKKQP